MQIEIIGKKGRTLKSISYNRQTYIEAPAKGEYKIRLRNTSASRRLAVVSVDGVNVLDGKDAGFDGRGYVLRAWETIDIPGWHRSNDKIAKFEFKEQGESYAAQTGRGTSNVGVIGVAVYDEKEQVYLPVYVPPDQFVPVQFVPVFPTIYSTNILRSSRMMKSSGDSSLGMMPEENTRGGVIMDSNVAECMEQRTSGGLPDSQAPASFACSVDSEPTKSAPVAAYNVQDVGTGYGHEAVFHTETTTFNRATSSPAFVMSVRYATRDRLISWGVPVDQMSNVTATAPNPFPSSMPSVPAPPGWRG